jgi:predicted transcriptional regulator
MHFVRGKEQLRRRLSKVHRALQALARVGLVRTRSEGVSLQQTYKGFVRFVGIGVV